jgi:spore coat protein U-like protein
MNVNKIARSIALASLVAASGTALAATDGTLGATSEGTAEVTMTVEDRVLITGLEDMALGTYSGSGALFGETAFCVYRNGTGLYDLTVSSDNQGASNEFRATDGFNFVTYTVLFDEDATAVDGDPIASGVEEEDLAGHATSTSCGGSENASVRVTFGEAALQSAPAGNYADTLTFLVEPS